MSDLGQHQHDATKLLKSLANPHRLRLLCALVDGESNVKGLNKWVPLSQPALSQHLARLRGDGLILCRKDSLEVFYRLADGPARDIIALLHQHYCETHPIEN